MTSEDNQEGFQGGLRFLRLAGLIAVLAGALGSVGFFLYASQQTPQFLRVLFVIWVLSPFVAFVLAELISKRWPVLTRTTLYWMMVVVTVGTLAVYLDDALRHPWARPAVVYVMVPPSSLALSVLAFSIAALFSRKRTPV